MNAAGTDLGSNVEVVRYRKSEVRIYRLPDGRSQVADRSTGKRRMISFTSHEAARARALELAKASAQGDVGAAAFTSRERLHYQRALALLPPEIELETALATFVEAYRVLGGNRVVEAARDFAKRNPSTLPQMSVAAAKDSYVTDLESRRKSLRHRQDVRHRLNKFAEAFNCSLATVTTPLLRDWLNGLGLAPQSLVNYRTVLRGFFRFCIGQQWLLADPAAELPRERVGDRDVRVYSPEEFAKLLAAAGEVEPRLLPSLVLGGFCGLRSAELNRLTWDAVKLRDGHVVVGAGIAKVKSRRVVPLPPNAAAWLVNAGSSRSPGERVWGGGEARFHEAARRVADAAKVPWLANGLRHSAASYLLARDADAGRVAGWLGNSADVVHRHYKALATEAEAKAWFSIQPGRPGDVLPLPRRPDEAVGVSQIDTEAAP
jgi:integrase